MAPQRNTDSRDSRHNHSPVEGAKGHWERPAHASSAYGDPYRTLPPTVEEEAATPDRVTTFFDTPEFRDARAQLLARQQGNVQRIQQHERVLEDHCPGATLTDMAAGESGAGGGEGKP